MSVSKVWSTVDGDKLIAYMARVSNPNNQNNHLTAPQLIKYLLDHKHYSPFEMANLCIEINTTRDIGRQILRHRSFTFQEFSQRYAEIDLLGEMVPREARLQDKKNRQASNETEDFGITVWFDAAQKEVWDVCIKNYKKALELGIAKEQARAFLPEGLTPTRMYMNGTLRSWVHFMQARLYEGAQKEVRLVAEGIENLVKEDFPMTYEAVQKSLR